MLEHITLSANKVPIYIQLREQFLVAIAQGLLKPGEQLPTVRTVSAQLSVNPNTVQQAYAELERDGVILVQRGRGTFVAENPPPLDPALRGAKLDALVCKLILDARSQGFSSKDIIERARVIDPEF